ncbi:peptide ABC transporter substrate-binding protein [Mesorhizobium sp. M1143]|uniref:peptide ABC transporter substrate-binding protein n=1 Tax=Mesorhizobium sp. M1143 TaxID=2957061 RepID=UPI003334BF39
MSALKLLITAGTMTLFVTSASADRGADGVVNILNWQAASMMNPYISGQDNDTIPASLVLEPLASYNDNGELFPRLAVNIPTIENGGVSKDMKSITWILKPGLEWSDGTPVTARDVVFTANYCMDPKMGCAVAFGFEGVEKIEALDDLTVKVTFKVPTVVPYTLFVGWFYPVIQAKQFADCLGAKAPTCTEANFYPIGTGPFAVTSFKPSDAIQLKANPHYRDPEKPSFSIVNFKGGGDALGAARAVLQTGEFDYALNLQIPPDVLSKMEKAGKGKIQLSFGTWVETLFMNLTDPSPTLPPDERSTVKHPNPILSDVRVRKALSIAIDRATLSEIGYGPMGKPTCDWITAPANFAAGNTECLKQDIPGAVKLLEEAGWKSGADGIREKDGKELKLTFVTTTNPIRNQAQAVIKQWWHEIGVEVDLKSVDTSVMFGGDTSNLENVQRFYTDVQMWVNYANGTDLGSYVTTFTCNQAPRPDNQWQGWNAPRYCDTKYDALVTELGSTADIEKRAEIVKQLNNMLLDSYAIVPLVWRASVSGISDTLGGSVLNAWDSPLWNAQDWYRKK